MNQLKHISEFKKILSHYTVSEDARKVLKKTKLVLLVGPTSSGRNTIINELLKSGKYHYIVSDTTRAPRKNNGILEQNGREYWFRTEDEILADLQSGQFLEAALIHSQQVSGISIRELQAAVAEDKIAINEIEVVGADNIYAEHPDTLFIFVLPPSFDEWMTRMKVRGTLPPDETKRRLRSAIKEINMALDRDFYWFVVNDTFMHTAEHLTTMIHEWRGEKATQYSGRKVAQKLVQDIQAYLSDDI